MNFPYEKAVLNENMPMVLLMNSVKYVTMHWHDRIEFVFVINDEITVQVGSNVYFLKEKDLIFINSNEVHGVEANTSNKVLLLQRKFLKESCLEEFGGIIAEVSEQITDPHGVVYRPIYTSFLEGQWYKGRVLLIGDAAHTTSPHLGQGAAITIEDAVVLASTLKRDLPLEECFEDFMKQRYERCKFVVETSNQLIEWELLSQNIITFISS